jgi:hypothetical protein
MSKAPTLTNIASGYASNTQLNNNFNAIEQAFENTLSLDGSTPNAMGADLDMNGNQILNATGLTIEGVDVFTLINKTTISINPPSGGLDGDIWFKVSS